MKKVIFPGWDFLNSLVVLTPLISPAEENLTASFYYRETVVKKLKIVSFLDTRQLRKHRSIVINYVRKNRTDDT